LIERGWHLDGGNPSEGLRTQVGGFENRMEFCGKTGFIRNISHGFKRF